MLMLACTAACLYNRLLARLLAHGCWQDVEGQCLDLLFRQHVFSTDVIAQALVEVLPDPRCAGRRGPKVTALLTVYACSLLPPLVLNEPMILEQQVVDGLTQAVRLRMLTSAACQHCVTRWALLQVGSNGNEQQRQAQLEGLYEQLFRLVTEYHQDAMQSCGLFFHDDGVAITITKVRGTALD